MSKNHIWNICEWKDCCYPGESSSGYFVSLTADGIQIASPNDEIFGITMHSNDPKKGKDGKVKERSCIGLLGVLTVRDDGTCTPGQKCTVSAEGIATPGDRWTVVSRECDHLVKILFK